MRASVFAAASVSLVALAFACSPSSGEGDPGAAEQNDTAQDLATAQKMLDLLGGPAGRCVACHTATPADVKTWGRAMKTVDSACMAASAGLQPRAQIDCLRDEPANPQSSFSPHKLGLYAAGAASGEFDALFAAAFPDASADAATQLATFKQRVKMPKAGAPLSASDWLTLKKWVLRGMPQLDQAAAGDAGADASTDADAGAECNDRVTPELTNHLTRMKSEGWGARLADLRTPMYGCAPNANPLSCLGSLPELTQTMGAANVAQKLRQLRVVGIRTNYWVRSSADGRYVGVGASPSRIFDLTADPTSKGIDVAAPYDPYFLRSNDGFGYAGTSGGISLCKQSLLADVAGMENPHISFTEAKCATVGSSVYESIGSALDGVSYFMTVGPHRNDDGGNSVTHPLTADYGSPSLTSFTPMVNDGTAYKAQTSVSVDLPGEGDVMLSPSGLLAATRFGNHNGKQVGFRVHLVKATPSGSSFNIQVPVGAEVCMKGGKPEISFDERFVAAHQYVDTTEPDQAGLPDGSSNIVIADMASGKKVRITNMGAGQYALYPHFRADGWLYFLVRDTHTGIETMVASDAALRLANP